ncbi:MAG: hypothetical protein JWO08_2758, partial [Verrucomicrobiaceae bacterium]|nr:hypothetical protein [Verrucomicrobiaceae bacterium]
MPHMGPIVGKAVKVLNEPINQG